MICSLTRSYFIATLDNYYNELHVLLILYPNIYGTAMVIGHVSADLYPQVSLIAELEYGPEQYTKLWTLECS